jgi:hypothetical protein
VLNRRIYDHLERHPRQRFVLFGLIGLALFTLGATYIRLQRRPDPLTHQLTTGDLVSPGWPLSLRLRARSAHAGVPLEPDVTAVELGGRAMRFTQTRGDPTLLHLEVPADLDATSLTVPLHLTVAEPATPNPLVVALPATPRDPEAATPFRRAPPLRPTKRSLRLALQPEFGELVSHLSNRVFVRVLTPAGAPLVGASVLISHADRSGPVTLPATDADGLTWFELKPKRPNLDIRATVSHPSLGEAPVETVQPLFAIGRQMVVDGLPPVQPADTPLPLKLRTTRDSGELHCDLRRGRAHLASWRLGLDADGLATLPLPPLGRPGRYDLQCFINVLMPGTTALSRAFWVGDAGALSALQHAGVAGGLLPAGVADAEPAALRWPWLVAGLSDREVPSALRLNTQRAAVEAADAAWEEQKTLTLASLAGAILLILLAGLDLALSQALANRARLRAWEAEAAASGEAMSADALDPVAHQPTSRLAETRGWLLLALAVGTVAANIVGFLLLSGMFLN